MVLGKFTNEQTARFVALYRDQQCLWRTDLPAYRDSVSRYAALDNIRVRMAMPSLTVDEVKKKIKYLRSTYKGEVNKIEKSRLRKDRVPYKPALAWFHQMHCFIKDVEAGASAHDDSVSTEHTEPTSIVIDDSRLDDECLSEETKCEESPAQRDPLQTVFRKFTKKETSRFIALYKEQECLWDPENADYRSRHARAAAMEHIRDNVDMTDLSINDIKKKIKYLRATYMCELNKIQRSVSSGAERVHKPCLSWFDEMHCFIKELNSVNKKKSRGSVGVMVKIENLNADEETEEGYSLDRLDASDSGSDRSMKRLRVSESVEHEEPSVQRTRDEGPDEYEIFARHVAAQLRSMAIEEAVKAQEAIQSVLTRFRLEQLRAERHSSFEAEQYRDNM